jgi:glycosyltransferase involved in cell wall biosynthesis
MLDELKRHYGAFCAAEPVYNGRSPREFRPTVKDTFAISVGRLWDAGKNAAILSEVAPRLRCPLYAAGETAGPDGVPVRLDGPILLGRLAEPAVAEWLSRAAVFTSPARYEPFGLSALEAALSGCALVLSDIPSFRELWDGAALFVAPDDAEGIAGAITRLMDDTGLRRDFSARARRRAASFTAERMAENYLALYRRMLSGEKPTVRNARDDRARLERSL